MHRLQPLLEEAFGKKMVLPERKLDSLAALIEGFPGVKRVMIDGTERPIQRPQDPQAHTNHYSGKQQRHTRTRVVCDNAFAGVKRYNAVSGVYRLRRNSGDGEILHEGGQTASVG
jgi:hypothetical protein